MNLWVPNDVLMTGGAKMKRRKYWIFGVAAVVVAIGSGAYAATTTKAASSTNTPPAYVVKIAEVLWQTGNFARRILTFQRQDGIVPTLAVMRDSGALPTIDTPYLQVRRSTLNDFGVSGDNLDVQDFTAGPF